MKNLETLIDQFESRIPVFATENEEISKSNVGWHIEHSLLTIIGITKVILRSNPENYQWKFKLSRLLIFTFGKIPRGKAKAPNVVVPKNEITETQLLSNIELTKKLILELKSISKDHYFEHPYLGKLKKKDTIRFLIIHTNHHLKIIEDIIKS
jgi:hypothetical protein